MKFLYQDLLNFLTEKPSKEILSEKLFQLGHEHEINGDIFDMEFTPNRGDCLSLLGLSRDLNYFFKSKDPFESYDENVDILNLNFKNLSIESCPKISFLEIEICGEISSYKPYLENYFLKLNNNKTNFFTDVSNYLSYERGQPTHCFDRESIKEELTFSNETCSENFRTLLGNEIKLKNRNCIFKTNGEIISLAGVMGGESTACSLNTKKVLVECAYFNPESIIGKAINYNLKSDAAHKFERGVDIELQEKVLRRFISIVKEHASVKNIRLATFIGTGSQIEEKFLPIDLERVNKILGTKLKNKEYLGYLSNLGFEIGDNIIKVPSFRHDVSSQNDLSEEIARIIGYDNIKSIPLKLNNHLKPKQDKIYHIESFLIDNGFSEVINYPFTTYEEKKSISIDNPLDSNRRNLRTSLKDSLIENLLYNERRQLDSIKLFEISDVYSNNENNIVQEKKIGIIISGRSGNNYIDFSKKLDKKYLEQTLNNKNLAPVFSIEEIPRENLKSKRKEKIYYAESLLEHIPDNIFKNSGFIEKPINFIRYIPVSEFPSSIRDFSFSIKNPEQYEKVISHIESFKDENLKDSFIFDFYLNKQLSEIKVGIRLIFQSPIKTLSDNDIQTSISNLLKPVIELDGVFIPGLELK